MDNMKQDVEQTPQFADTKKGGLGPILGIILIIILLALGGLYYFTTGVDQVQNGTQEAEIMQAQEVATELREQSSSNTIADIESDIEATDFSGLDEASADFNLEIEAE